MTITAQHPHPLRFGAAYYPEYQPSLGLERDRAGQRAQALVDGVRPQLGDALERVAAGHAPS